MQFLEGGIFSVICHVGGGRAEVGTWRRRIQPTSLLTATARPSDT